MQLRRAPGPQGQVLERHDETALRGDGLTGDIGVFLGKKKNDRKAHELDGPDIAESKRAYLIVPGNPPNDISAMEEVRFVMKARAIYKRE